MQRWQQSSPLEPAKVRVHFNLAWVLLTIARFALLWWWEVGTINRDTLANLTIWANGLVRVHDATHVHLLVHTTILGLLLLLKTKVHVVC